MRKHAAMIEAWARNAELVVFCRGSEWLRMELPPSWNPHLEYFACLPQHAEECLYWLNGGEVQLGNYQVAGKWHDTSCLEVNGWCNSHMFMQSGQDIRIKPKKKKRYWVLYDKSEGDRVIMTSSDPLAYPTTKNWRVMEIEVEL